MSMTLPPIMPAGLGAWPDDPGADAGRARADGRARGHDGRQRHRHRVHPTADRAADGDGAAEPLRLPRAGDGLPGDAWLSPVISHPNPPPPPPRPLPVLIHSQYV